MFRPLKSVLHRRKAAEANATAGTPSESTLVTTRTETADAGGGTTGAADLEQMPELYSTEGDYGMEVIAEPSDASLE
jgi:hypothetical protein